MCQGVQDIAKGLLRNSTLRALKVAACGVSIDDCLELVSSFKHQSESLQQRHQEQPQQLQSNSATKKKQINESLADLDRINEVDDDDDRKSIDGERKTRKVKKGTGAGTTPGSAATHTLTPTKTTATLATNNAKKRVSVVKSAGKKKKQEGVAMRAQAVVANGKEADLTQDPLVQSGDERLTSFDAYSRQPRGITTIDLSSNPQLNRECGESILDCMKLNRWLVSCNVRGTDIPQDLMAAISVTASTNAATQ